MCILQIVLLVSLATVQPSGSFDVTAHITPAAPCRAALWIEAGQVVTVEDMARDVRLDGASVLTWHVRALADVPSGAQPIVLYQDGMEVARTEVRIVETAPREVRVWLPLMRALE